MAGSLAPLDVEDLIIIIIIIIIYLLYNIISSIHIQVAKIWISGVSQFTAS